MTSQFCMHAVLTVEHICQRAGLDLCLPRIPKRNIERPYHIIFLPLTALSGV
jgi:hypothetical protein